MLSSNTPRRRGRTWSDASVRRSFSDAAQRCHCASSSLHNADDATSIGPCTCPGCGWPDSELAADTSAVSSRGWAGSRKSLFSRSPTVSRYLRWNAPCRHSGVPRSGRAPRNLNELRRLSSQTQGWKDFESFCAARLGATGARSAGTWTII